MHQRFCEKVVPNPNSAVVWHYDRFDQNMDGEFDFEEVMHRSISSPAIKNDLLVTADFSGLVHCLDAKSGTVYWTHDMLAACWSEPLIVEDKIYVVNEDGEVVVVQLSPEPPGPAAPTLGAGETIRHVQMPDSIFQAPVVANDVLYIATKCHLFAITNDP